MNLKKNNSKSIKLMIILILNLITRKSTVIKRQMRKFY